MSADHGLLLVGEVYVDFTLPKAGSDSKVRLGGVVHAARGLWAIDARYAVAAACPGYLVDQVRSFLEHHGCSEFIWLADIKGAPNVMAIGDPTELADQAYQDLLRHEKTVELLAEPGELRKFMRCVIYPGKYELQSLASLLHDSVRVSFDISYDLSTTDPLDAFTGRIDALITSTSSGWFLDRAASAVSTMLDDLRRFSPRAILLKENRGGSRVFDVDADSVEEIPALLDETVNSVGVGDVYSAIFVEFLSQGISEAAWKAARGATCYAQTTYPDDFKRDVQRSHAISVDEMRGLGGTNLPWHARQDFQIYFAAPDFSYIDRKFIEEALSALAYHNFRVRRPVEENGELNPESGEHEIKETYSGDIRLLSECDLVFALPFGCDPGTLVEIGLAIASKIPVITYDPNNENSNTMVIGGSQVYSSSLDICLNGVFEVMSKLRAEK